MARRGIVAVLLFLGLGPGCVTTRVIGVETVVTTERIVRVPAAPASAEDTYVPERRHRIDRTVTLGHRSYSRLRTHAHDDAPASSAPAPVVVVVPTPTPYYVPTTCGTAYTPPCSTLVRPPPAPPPAPAPAADASGWSARTGYAPTTPAPTTGTGMRVGIDRR